MEILILSIPFVVAIFLLIFYRKETVWWEYLLLIIPSLLVTLGFEWIFKKANMSDTEYYGDYVVRIRHEDAWNEWIKKTCTRKVPDGKDEDGNTKYREERYDCSYCEEHPERWIFYTESGACIYTSEKIWEGIRKKLNSPMIFIDCHRDYYTKDGDAQEYKFSGDWKRSQPVTWARSYDNPVMGSRSLFGFRKISEEEADSFGLFKYPDIMDIDQSPVLGIRLPEQEDLALRRLNARCGRKYQFRLYTIFWKDKDPEISGLQRAYWQGGNKNELVVCIGLSGNTRKIDWVRCFSWEDSPVLSVKVRDWLQNQKTYNTDAYVKYVESLLTSGQWHRKQFKDFDYVSVELTDLQVIVLLILTLIYNIGISIYIVRNEFENGECNDNSPSPRGYYGGY